MVYASEQGMNSARVFWNAPNENGDSMVNYRVTATLTGFNSSSTCFYDSAGECESSCVLFNLTRSGRYAVTVQGCLVNRVDNSRVCGPHSKTISVSTKGVCSNDVYSSPSNDHLIILKLASC